MKRRIEADTFSKLLMQKGGVEPRSHTCSLVDGSVTGAPKGPVSDSVGLLVESLFLLGPLILSPTLPFPSNV